MGGPLAAAQLPPIPFCLLWARGGSGKGRGPSTSPPRPKEAKGDRREVSRRQRPGPAEGDSPKVSGGARRYTLLAYVRVRASDRAGGPRPAAHRDQDVLPLP